MTINRENYEADFEAEAAEREAEEVSILLQSVHDWLKKRRDECNSRDMNAIDFLILEVKLCYENGEIPWNDYIPIDDFRETLDHLR